MKTQEEGWWNDYHKEDKPEKDEGEKGTGFAWFVFMVFLVLRITRIVYWSWWFIFAPLWSWYVSIAVYYFIFYWSKYEHEKMKE